MQTITNSGISEQTAARIRRNAKHERRDLRIVSLALKLRDIRAGKSFCAINGYRNN